VVPSKANPLKLNPLQLRTLAIMQELAHDPAFALPPDASGTIAITQMPHAHGNHFHIGNYLVAASHAGGLRNEQVWKALERKGLARSAYPQVIALTAAGLSYETGIRGEILHGSDH
jgi:hypothetical protein